MMAKSPSLISRRKVAINKSKTHRVDPTQCTTSNISVKNKGYKNKSIHLQWATAWHLDLNRSFRKDIFRSRTVDGNFLKQKCTENDRHQIFTGASKQGHGYLSMSARYADHKQRRKCRIFQQQKISERLRSKLLLRYLLKLTSSEAHFRSKYANVCVSDFPAFSRAAIDKFSF